MTLRKEKEQKDFWYSNIHKLSASEEYFPRALSSDFYQQEAKHVASSVLLFALIYSRKQL